jgi:hypothetical protein
VFAIQFAELSHLPLAGSQLQLPAELVAASPAANTKYILN